MSEEIGSTDSSENESKRTNPSKKKIFAIIGGVIFAFLAITVWQLGYGEPQRAGNADMAGGGDAFNTFEDRVSSTSKTREWSIGNIFNSKKTETTTETTTESSPPPASEAMAVAPEVSRDATMPPVYPPSQGRQPRPQAGLLTGGDYDDLLNPELYANYASNFLQETGARDLPFVDTREKIEIKVQDQRGRPVPFARISVPRTKGGNLSLVTAATGKAVIFPRFDRIAPNAQISVHSGTRNTTARIGNGDEVTVRMPGNGSRVQAADIVIALDTTGSMGDEIDYLESELADIMSRMRSEAGQIDLRIGLVVYRDEGDEYVVQKYNFSRDVGAMQATLAQQYAGGGGDTPEAMDQAMQSVEEFQWRPNAAKAVLLVADAPPHQQNLNRTLQSTERLRRQGVQIVPVAASGVDPMAEYAMRTMALMTQGRYIFITDDSGIGNPHAEPQVDCYVVTSLNDLIARVLSGIVRGERIEPGQGEIIRSVGSYDRGRCSIDRQDYPQLTSKPLPVWES